MPVEFADGGPRGRPVARLRHVRIVADEPGRPADAAEAGRRLPDDTAARPYLDGKLDDKCWQDAIPMLLTTMAGELGAELRVQGSDRKAVPRQGRQAGARTPCAKH